MDFDEESKEEQVDDQEEILDAFNTTIRNIAKKSERLSTVDEEVPEEESEKVAEAMLRLHRKKVRFLGLVSAVKILVLICVENQCEKLL